MKFSDWPRGFEYPNVAESIEVRMRELEATEEASLMLRDEEDNPRALISTDLALLDCHFATEKTGEFQVKAIPWDSVAVPWIVFSWYDEHSVVTTFRLDLDPLATGVYRDQAESDAARDFYRSVIRHRRDWSLRA